MLEQVKQFKDQFIKEHPETKENVEDLFQLMLDEIEEGGSIFGEIQSFYSSCDELIS